MIGDFVVWFRKSWKQLWCIHEYVYRGHLDMRYKECVKCERVHPYF